MTALTHRHDAIAAPALTMIGGLIGLWAMRWRTRRHLARLDRRLLADLGINPIDALREAEKPFWQA